MLRECIEACTPKKTELYLALHAQCGQDHVAAWPPEPVVQCRHEHADLAGHHRVRAAGRIMPSAPMSAGAGARLQHNAEHHGGGGVDDGHAAVEHAQAKALGVGRQHERHHGEHGPGRAHRQQRAQRHHRQHERVPAPAAALLRDHTLPYPIPMQPDNLRWLHSSTVPTDACPDPRPASQPLRDGRPGLYRRLAAQTAALTRHQPAWAWPRGQPRQARAGAPRGPRAQQLGRPEHEHEACAAEQAAHHGGVQANGRRPQEALLRARRRRPFVSACPRPVLGPGLVQHAD